VDFFDIFIFNNVKSGRKSTFCQQNKADSDVKLLTLYRLYPYRKSRWAEVGQTYIWYKAFLYALVLTCRNLAVHNTICQKQSNAERLMRCIIYSPHWLWTILSFVVMGAFYIFTLAWGFRRCISVVHSKMIFLICYLLDYQQVHDNANVSIILLGDKKEPTK